jgi:hypothetical protein
MGPDDEPTPIGVIFDANSRGRFDLVIYADGLLAVKGTYVGVMLQGAGAGAGGAGAGVGWSSGRRYEQRRLSKKLQRGRAQLMHEAPNFFIPRDSIADLALRKRWHGHSLILRTHDDRTGRRFEWKPALNNFAEVEERLRSVFAGAVRRD